MSTQQETETFTLSMEREFDAPRELVFNAFMDPDQLSAWFGPEGVDSPRDRITVEPRVGGVWKVVMVYEEDGAQKESPIDSVIEEYDPPRLLVASQLESDLGEGQPQVFSMRLEFEDLGGRTLLKLTQSGFTNQEWVDMTREGWESSFGILERTVAAHTVEGNVLTMRRVFDAPRELVFDAWVDPAQLEQWWAPDTLHTKPGSAKVDAREGGRWHAIMVADEGGEEYPSSGTLTIFDRPAKLRLYEPATESYPSDSTVTVTFQEIAGKTLLTMVQRVDTETPEFTGMTQGWSEMFVKLDRVLA